MRIPSWVTERDGAVQGKGESFECVMEAGDLLYSPGHMCVCSPWRTPRVHTSHAHLACKPRMHSSIRLALSVGPTEAG
jgi:hypothetical protein